MLRNTATVIPISEKARNDFANYLNNKNQVRVEHKKGNRIFVSAWDNPDYWFWVDAPQDDNWLIEENK